LTFNRHQQAVSVDLLDIEVLFAGHKTAGDYLTADGASQLHWRHGRRAEDLEDHVIMRDNCIAQ
jgi:hypothetical protein